KKTKFIGRHSTITKVAKHFRPMKKRTFISRFVNVYDYGIKNLDFIICQSADMKTDFLESYNYNPDNVCIINNPITNVDILKHLNKDNSDEIKKFITIGRLREIKGHERLLEVLSRLKTPFTYTIIGDGDNKDKIFNKIKELKLEEEIKYIKHTNDVFEHLAKHDFFLQGSYSEGFPNTLLESCTTGTPVIAFDVPGGTKEIVENGVNGFLVNSEEEFLERLNENIDWDPKIVSESVYKKFNKDKIISEYEQLFINLLKE
ncbi:MAG: glycosyltransferase, partial [Ferruginibacter sp.]